MKIGKLETGNVFLAPMAGVTDLAFRKLCREFGADLAFSEMVSAKALCAGDKKTFSLLNFTDEPHYRAAQLFGSEPDVLYSAAQKVSEIADIIDFNMGCPAPKITGNGEGSALMDSPSRAEAAFSALCKGAKVPVTVKIRRGFKAGCENAVEIAKMCEACGASAITVHGRYAASQYSGTADLEIIERVKRSVKIPVIGNGDITSPKAAQNMLDRTGCDAVMIGRGALGNPFIFREIKEFFNGTIPAPPTIREKVEVALRHIDMLVFLKGEHIAILEARKHVAWYVKGLRGASQIKIAANSAKTYDEMRNLLLDILTEYE